VAWILTKVALLFPIPKGAEPHISLMTGGVAVGLLVVVGLIAGVGPARRRRLSIPSRRYVRNDRCPPATVDGLA
jgi:hypothetical protein